MTNNMSDHNNNLAEADSSVDVATLFPVDRADMTQLRARLSVDAADNGLLDIAYRTIDTPVGPLLLAATQKGLVRVAFECEGFDTVLEVLASKISPRVIEAPRRLDAVAAELEEYFSGQRQLFDVPLDYTLSSGFREVVQRYLPDIRYGHTQSYKEVAARVGNTKAVRAVGTACATNPLPVVVPCHRVVRSDGGLGGYIGGLDAKTALLSLEKIA